MDTLIMPLSIMISFPWLAFVVAFILAYWNLHTNDGRKKKRVLLPIALWFFYGIYEFSVYYEVICSGDCNIRVDLILIYPVLLVALVVSLIQGYLFRKKK